MQQTACDFLLTMSERMTLLKGNEFFTYIESNKKYYRPSNETPAIKHKQAGMNPAQSNAQFVACISFMKNILVSTNKSSRN